MIKRESEKGTSRIKVIPFKITNQELLSRSGRP